MAAVVQNLELPVELSRAGSLLNWQSGTTKKDHLMASPEYSEAAEDLLGSALLV